MSASAILLPLAAAAFVLPSSNICSREVLGNRIYQMQAAATVSPSVFLTREAGNNGKLERLLKARNVPTEELPCIAFERLAGYDKLCGMLSDGLHDWIVLTSPEAAATFIDAWRESGEPSLAQLAAVGAGTEKILGEVGLNASFVPSKATGKTLAAELPAKDGGAAGLVLYPASALAATTVEVGLQARGFLTERIETYTTVPAVWSADELDRARGAEVVAFASPSAARAWADRAGTSATAVCIGETSAEECRKIGFECVRCPEKPGIEAWAQQVVELDLW